MTKLQVRTTPELMAISHAWQVPARGAHASDRACPPSGPVPLKPQMSANGLPLSRQARR